MAQQMSPERLPRLEKQWKLVLEKTIFPVSNKCDNDSYDKVATVICNFFSKLINGTGIYNNFIMQRNL